MFSQLLALLLLQAAPPSPPSEPAVTVQEVVEVRSGRVQAEQDATASTAYVDEEDIVLVRPVHPAELLLRVPGAWINRGSGQEHLSAIRSPVFTGGGACGAFLVLEDRVPVRPTGFCNINGLFEVNLAQARRVEVLRGPGTVIYGSNALHGVISVFSRNPGADSALRAQIEAGSHDYYRGELGWSGERFALTGHYTDSHSFREDEQSTHAQFNAAWLASVGAAQVRTSLAATDLDQDTAGYILGRSAYRDPDLRKENLNPEAFRKGTAFRLVSAWTWQSGDAALEWIPFLRTSDMDFLQHFLPGKPLERNGQDSAGMLFSWRRGDEWAAGLDLEWADGYLTEYQALPLTTGSPFLQATRPQGFHYDYETESLAAAAWAQYTHRLRDELALTAGLRYEWLAYDYRNHLPVGNTRDDGSRCGFGGCLYTRPGDRTDRFRNLAPELGLEWALSDRHTLRARLARGFRAPQVTELYRLQSGQEVADLRTTTLDALELGLHGEEAGLSWDVSLYAMRKDHFIFRDGDGFNVSDGQSSHLGAELGLSWRPAAEWRVGANLTRGRHRYEFDRDLGRGELIRDGNTMDTAPEWFGSLRAAWIPRAGSVVELEWVHMGSYFLDAANDHKYGGHDLLNLRARLPLPGGQHSIGLRCTNLLDRAYAERADYAFGNYRYFPGAGRQLFLNWEYRR